MGAVDVWPDSDVREAEAAFASASPEARNPRREDRSKVFICNHLKREYAQSPILDFWV
jgi:hypothetical protein